jgi:hypothetical protein
MLMQTRREGRFCRVFSALTDSALALGGEPRNPVAVMQSQWKFLVVADDSPEFPAAALYAGLRAKVTGGNVVVLRVIEPSSYVQWVSVGEEMRREAWDEARKLTARVAADLSGEAGVDAEIQIREGDLRQEIRKLLEEDADIRILVLASAVEGEDPGPLVASLAKGIGFGGQRAIPVVVVPGALSRADIATLALPVAGNA